MTTHNASSLTSWIRVIKYTLDQQGVDSAALFDQAGLDVAALSDPNARYSLASTTRLWGLARQATGDPAIGLKVAANVTHTTFHALGYALLASPTLRHCFERLLRYFRIVTDAAELEFRANDGDYSFIIHPLQGQLQPADEAVDAMMSVIIGMCRLLYGSGFQARRIMFRRPAPSDVAAFEKVFAAPLSFGASESAIIIDDTILEAALPSANRELARHNDEILVRYLANFDRNNIVNRVHEALIEQLPYGEPLQKNIAESLHVSPRNLQRKLSEQDASYKEILNRTRRDLALTYIADSHYSISEITYLLGFAATSSFTRAFKRWTGQAPTGYRGAKRAVDNPFESNSS